MAGLSRTDLITAIVRGLSEPQCSAAIAEANVPEAPGYYSLFVDTARSLPAPFGELLGARGTNLIYAGIATRSLRIRLVDQDLRHRRASTFFRGIGAVLGYRPLRGSLLGMKNLKNYRFTSSDTLEIIEWINAHLAVGWVAGDAQEKVEAAVITHLRPLMNSKHNPDRLKELSALRALCRHIALTTSIE